MKIGWGRQQSGVTLDRLDDHRRYLLWGQIGGKGLFDHPDTIPLTGGILHRCIKKGKVVDLRQKRPHPPPRSDGDGGQRRCAVGAAVVAVEKRDDLGPSGIGAGKLHRRVVAIAAAEAKADLGLCAAGINGRQTLRVFDTGAAVGVRDGVLCPLPDLIHNGRVNSGLTAPQIKRGRAGEKIDIAVFILIIDHILLRLRDNKGKIGKVRAWRNDLFVPLNPLHTFLDRPLHTRPSAIYFY